MRRQHRQHRETRTELSSPLHGAQQPLADACHPYLAFSLSRFPQARLPNTLAPCLPHRAWPWSWARSCLQRPPRPQAPHFPTRCAHPPSPERGRRRREPRAAWRAAASASWCTWSIRKGGARPCVSCTSAGGSAGLVALNTKAVCEDRWTWKIRYATLRGPAHRPHARPMVQVGVLEKLHSEWCSSLRFLYIPGFKLPSRGLGLSAGAYLCTGGKSKAGAHSTATRTST